MPARPYSVEFEAQSVTNANGDYDLFEIGPADDKPVELVGFSLAVTSELGDAAEEMLRLRVIRGHSTTGNGTSATPRPMSSVDTAAGFAAEVLSSTPASSGTAINLWSGAFNVRGPYDYWWPADMTPWCSQADGLIVLRLMAAVLDDVTMSGTLYLREYP